MGLIWDKKSKRYYREEEILTRNEIDERHKRIKNALRMSDEKVQMVEEDKFRRGYCPKCRLLLPLSGECDCGYKKSQKKMELDKIKKYPHKSYVNPEILKMYK